MNVLRAVSLSLFALLAVAPFARSVSASSQAPADPATRRVIRITAERFLFFPSRITLTAGDDVELRITRDDPAHGFRLVGGDVNLVIPKRGKGQATAVVRLQEPGKYQFECSRMCGAGHNFMRGELIVREADGRSTP